MITDYQRPFSAVNWSRAHVLAVDSESERKRYKDTLKANMKHCDIAPPELEEPSTGSVRLAITLQDLNPAV